MEALQQSVVQVPRDSCALADARLQRHLKVMMQAPDSVLVGRPQQCQKELRRRARETSSSGSTPGQTENSKVSPCSFQTPLLLAAMTRNR